MTLTEKDKETVRQIVREELSEQQAAGAAGQTAEEQQADAARNVLTGQDVLYGANEGLTPQETLHERYGIDVEDHETQAELRAAVEEARDA